jgi:shikimate dehydrogenase
MAIKKYALLGWPVAHSVSPQMQEAGFRALGLSATYELIATPPAELGQTIARLREEGYAGWNVTVPHKEEVGQYLDELDPASIRAGSVNTIVNCQGRLTGTTTDGYGMERAVEESFGLSLPGATVVFIGTGGASRAVAVHFASLGVRRLVLANRTAQKAEVLAEHIRSVAPQCEIRVLSLGGDADQLQSELQQASLLIQATSLGLHEGDPLPVSPDILPPSVAVMDMIYRLTPFQAAAAARGCQVADGRGMLLHQGVRSFELWTGCQASPLEAMRAGLELALSQKAQKN